MKTGQKPSFEIAVATLLGTLMAAAGPAFIMPLMTVAALFFARPALIENARLRLKAIRITSSEHRSHRRG